jgi:hypothetical protein
LSIGPFNRVAEAGPESLPRTSTRAEKLRRTRQPPNLVLLDLSLKGLAFDHLLDQSLEHVQTLLDLLVHHHPTLHHPGVLLAAFLHAHLHLGVLASDQAHLLAQR